jgi:outer membrane protein OmpA-like peptidoglycan-associated protein
VPGIFFDTGKSELKPESAAAVGEVAKLLKADAALKVYVVGHTDNVAALELNLRLSQARAEAVMQALMSQHGIAAARLAARGVGPLAPVASNDNEEGRAKNRRVELVKQ